MATTILKHQDLIVYRKAFEASMQTFDLMKNFPKGETAESETWIEYFVCCGNVEPEIAKQLTN